MRTFVVTVIYNDAQPVAYEVQANTRSEAIRLAWNKYEQVADHIKKLSVVLK